MRQERERGESDECALPTGERERERSVAVFLLIHPFLSRPTLLDCLPSLCRFGGKCDKATVRFPSCSFRRLRTIPPRRHLMAPPWETHVDTTATPREDKAIRTAAAAEAALIQHQRDCKSRGRRKTTLPPLLARPGRPLTQGAVHRSVFAAVTPFSFAIHGCRNRGRTSSLSASMCIGTSAILAVSALYRPTQKPKFRYFSRN